MSTAHLAVRLSRPSRQVPARSQLGGPEQRLVLATAKTIRIRNAPRGGGSRSNISISSSNNTSSRETCASISINTSIDTRTTADIDAGADADAAPAAAVAVPVSRLLVFMLKLMLMLILLLLLTVIVVYRYLMWLPKSNTSGFRMPQLAKNVVLWLKANPAEAPFKLPVLSF